MRYIVFVFVFLAGLGESAASTGDDPFQSRLVQLSSTTNLLIPDERNRLDQIYGSHELRLSWEVMCSDSDSLYCFYPSYYSIESEDNEGNPFVRAKIHEQLPPYRVIWMGQHQDGTHVEGVVNEHRLGIHAACDRVPPEVHRLALNMPAWRVLKMERVRVPVTEERVWQDLPNGSRVMVVIEPEYGKYKNIAIYREHSFSDNYVPAPPPFHLTMFTQTDGAALQKWAGHSKNAGLVPENPAEASSKRVALIRQRFDPETESPNAAELSVVYEYEQFDLKVTVEHTPLGDAPPRDQVTP